MFEGFSQETVDFMWQLRFNNERSWFQPRKEEFNRLLGEPMNALARELYDGFAAKHPELGLELRVSRIYRDARRLHGGGPYRDHLWFTLRPVVEEWTARPCFWFELGPEEQTWGLGYYMARPQTMQRLRERIDADPAPLERLDRRLSRSDTLVLDGDEYARPKRPADAPLARWYNKRNLSIYHSGESGGIAFSPELAARLCTDYEFLLPYYKYLMSLE